MAKKQRKPAIKRLTEDEVVDAIREACDWWDIDDLAKVYSMLFVDEDGNPETIVVKGSKCESDPYRDGKRVKA